MSPESDVASDIPYTRVYGGPLEEFVRRRDALMRELRSAGDRDTANAVKALRKPSRIAWALDQGAITAQDAFDALVAAAAATLEAQTAGGDVRTAMATLRGTVREFADRSADAARDAGYDVEAGVLVNAVLAVLGRPDSFDQLRAGRLVEVPEGGGLDFLAGLPVPASSAKPKSPASAASASKQKRSSAREKEAQAQVDAAERALDEARRRHDVAMGDLEEAESTLSQAEARLRKAEKDVKAAVERLAQARKKVDSIVTAVQKAHDALEQAQERLAQI